MSVRTPSAGVVIYSYKDRGGSKSNFPDQSVESIYVTKSIISISTTKNKSKPSGNFEIRLAPSKNWIASISPGSWLEIHMSPKKMTVSDLEASSSKTLKMIGCVDSVRMEVSVDQASGARMTTYSVVGRDWGCVFESHLYIDSTAQTASDSQLQQVLKPLFMDLISNQATAKTGIYSSTQLVRELIDAWGATMALIPSNAAPSSTDRINPWVSYAVPGKLVSKLNASPASGTNLARLIKIKSGYLSDYDTYSEFDDSFGILNTQGLIGINMVWQLLNSHCNNIINELVADLRWDSNKPSIALYKRIKPFALNNKSKTWSSFFKVKRHNLQTNDIVNLNVGDNAEDVVNYIEVMPDLSIYSLSNSEKIGVLSNAKGKNSRLKPGLISRHGIKPLLYSTSFTPSSGNEAKWDQLANWLDILGHWYFDCHKMLNGVVTVVGQDEYIGVGDNISIDSKVLGKTSYVAGKPAKFLAHIESVQHRFSFSEGGSRSFITSISFVRGVMTDDKCEFLVGADPYGIETKQNSVTEENLKIDNTYIE